MVPNLDPQLGCSLPRELFANKPSPLASPPLSQPNLVLFLAFCFLPRVANHLANVGRSKDVMQSRDPCIIHLTIATCKWRQLQLYFGVEKPAMFPMVATCRSIFFSEPLPSWRLSIPLRTKYIFSPGKPAWNSSCAALEVGLAGSTYTKIR